MHAVRICFIGDSFVNGTGDPACLGWAGRVCATEQAAGHDVTYYNLGVRRDTSADIAERWHAEAAARLPAGVDGRLVFSFGVNDTVVEGGRQRVALPETLANARAVLTAAAAWLPTLMVGPPSVIDAAQQLRVGSLSAALATLCAEIGVPYLEVNGPLGDAAVWAAEVAAGDGAHPAAEGYLALARLFERWAPSRAWFDA